MTSSLHQPAIKLNDTYKVMTARGPVAVSGRLASNQFLTHYQAPISKELAQSKMKDPVLQTKPPEAWQYVGVDRKHFNEG